MGRSGKRSGTCCGGLAGRRTVLSFNRTLKPGDRNLKDMLVPAIFWSVVAFGSFNYLLYNVVIPLHFMLERGSAILIWRFATDGAHPAHLAIVGFMELFIGWLCFLHFRRNELEYEVLRPGRVTSASVVFTVIGALLLPDWFASLLEPFFRGAGGEPADAFKEGAIRNFLAAQLLTFFVVAVVIAPVIEEFLFRGAFISTALASRWPKALVVVASSAGFAYIHGQYTPFGLAIVFMMGVGLGGLRIWSGGLALPMIAHCVHNFKAFLASLALAM